MAWEEGLGEGGFGKYYILISGIYIGTTNCGFHILYDRADRSN
jgi:hypothetical protein